MSAPSFGEMTRVFGRIGLLSFGGPAAQIALMHRELVEERPWLEDNKFLGALSFCMLLPGPEAMQLATYCGWKLRGISGGILAGLLFVLPGALIILALAMLYLNFGTLPGVQTAFMGIKAAVIAIVLQALLKVSGKALKTQFSWGVAVAAFIAIFALGLPFPLIILLAAIAGYWHADSAHVAAPMPAPHRTHSTFRYALLFLFLWITPIGLIFLSGNEFLLQIASFFSKLAVVTFGGAYAVLAYMTQTVVADHGWLTTSQMIDALGLAETTPGPLILVTEFVALLAGHSVGGIPMMLLAGLVALWCTFTPCFIWIFLGAPYVDRLLSHPRLSGAMQAISAAVVGVILNLSIWFAMHVYFTKLNFTAFGMLPDLTSLQIVPMVLTFVAAVLLFWRRLTVLPLLAIMVLLASLTYFL